MDVLDDANIWDYDLGPTRELDLVGARRLNSNVVMGGSSVCNVIGIVVVMWVFDTVITV